MGNFVTDELVTKDFSIFTFVRDYFVSISYEKTLTKATKIHEKKEFNIPV